MQTLPELVQQTERLVGLVGGQQQRVASLTAEVDRGEQESTLLTVTQATLDKLLQTMSAESVGKVERLVTYGLKTVFPDQDLTFRFDIQTKFRQPWLEPHLVHHRPGHEDVDEPIVDAFGGGPASVVAFILRVVVVSRMGLAPLILLDEPFSMVSMDGSYLSRVGALLKDLSRSLKLQILMVTQLPEFLAHADRAYQAEESLHGGTVFKSVDPRASQTVL